MAVNNDDCQKVFRKLRRVRKGISQVNAAKLEDAKLAEKGDEKSSKSGNETVDSLASGPFVQLPYQQPNDMLALGTTPEFQVCLLLNLFQK